MHKRRSRGREIDLAGLIPAKFHQFKLKKQGKTMKQKGNKKRVLSQLMGKLNQQYQDFDIRMHNYYKLIEFWDAARKVELWAITTIIEEIQEIQHKSNGKYDDILLNFTDKLTRLRLNNKNLTSEEFEEYCKFEQNCKNSFEGLLAIKNALKS